MTDDSLATATTTMPVVQPSRSSRTAILRGRRSAVRQRQQEQYRIQQPLQQQQRPARTQPQIQPERLEQQQYQQQQQNQPKIQRQQQQQQQQEQQQQQRRQQQTKATLPITDCIVTLGRFDTNKDLVVTRTEFADVLDAWECSIYAADWDGAFGAAACTCRDYDVSTCCDDGNANDNENSDNDAATSPGAVIHRPGKYPSQYTFDVCALLASVVDTQCDNPLNRVTPFPTSAPADFIVPETTMAPTPFRSSSGGDDNRDVDVAVVDNDGVSTTSWIVAVSSVAVIAFCCGVCCAANGFRRRRHRRYQQQWWRNDFSKNTHRHRSANGASFKSSSGVAKGALQRDRQLVLDRTDSTSEGPDEEQPYEYDSRRHNNDHTEKNSSEEPVRSRSPLHLFEDESDTSSEPDGTTRPSPRKFAPPSSGSEDLEYELMQSSTNSSVTSGHQPITADVAGSAAPSSSSSNSSVRSGQHFAYDFSGLLDEMQGAILQWAELPKPNSFTESEVDIDASYTTTNEEHDARSSSSPSTYGPATPPHLQQQHQNRSSSPSSDQKEDSVPTPNLDGWTDLDNVEDLAEGLMDAFPPPPPLFARTPSFDDDMNEEETKRPKPTPVAEVTVSSHNGDDKPTIVSPLSTRGMTFPDTPSSEPTEWTETFDNANTSPLRDHPQPESEEAIRSRLSSSSSFADLDTSGESDILVDASTLADPLDHHEHLDSPENLSHTSISFDDDNVYGQDYVPVAEGAAPFAGSPGKWSNASTSSGMSAAAESPSKWSNASTSSGMSAAAESPGKWSDASTSSGVSAGADSPGKWSNASTSPGISGAGSPGKWSNASTSSSKSDR